ncbi:hypothetical protein CC78DRAFT_534335 [Lojkania enalia]|uniref:Uncharacterized protein n=1 Tax=Lojkania enalia TaxID=147567 RepID=A0A9P4N249_9PLEO|nr:hypothetical protein CC78DRAFT_534335 [Didymosphaeria enalia]
MSTTTEYTQPEAPPDTTSQETPPKLNPYVLRAYNDRLGMPFDRRILAASTSAFICGFTLGSTTAGRLASLRFRAENAHRLPVSQPGWYLYHKSKNYYKWKTGVVEGVRKGVWLACWASVFFVVEESLDVFRGTFRAGRTLSEMEGVDELEMGGLEKCVQDCRDFVSSSVAGMATGGLWSIWNQFPIATAARTCSMGLAVGLGYGLGQDALRWAKRRYGGERVGGSWVYGVKKEVRE